jgi:hypothetical protein
VGSRSIASASASRTRCAPCTVRCTWIARRRCGTEQVGLRELLAVSGGAPSRGNTVNPPIGSRCSFAIACPTVHAAASPAA